MNKHFQSQITATCTKCGDLFNLKYSYWGRVIYFPHRKNCFKCKIFKPNGSQDRDLCFACKKPQYSGGIWTPHYGCWDSSLPK